ncbi:MAG: nucleotidyltransferase domain-containing protein [Solirubrobacterales bacterium]|nr:nucleotidyltransferase domain-containing protein [Solirubrobacterales bacterium]
MGSLDQATLSADERTVLERFVDTLHLRLGDELDAVWLFGSRARGERVTALSDVDVLVIAKDATWSGSTRIHEALHDVAHEVALSKVAWAFSVHVHDSSWIDQRRAIESFFVAEVDRDHIDLTPA